MEHFNVIKFVKCIRSFENEVTCDHNYPVVEELHHTYHVIANDGTVRSYNKSRFNDLEKPTINKSQWRSRFIQLQQAVQELQSLSRNSALSEELRVDLLNKSKVLEKEALDLYLNNDPYGYYNWRRHAR